MKHFTIAIDGPGGAGKSSVADHVAKELSVPHLDTGAMYRAFGYQAIAEGLDARNEADMDTLAARAQMDVRFDGGRQYTLVNGQDVTDKIRTPEVSMAASDCAVFGSVRQLMVRLHAANCQPPIHHFRWAGYWHTGIARRDTENFSDGIAGSAGAAPLSGIIRSRRPAGLSGCAQRCNHP